MLRLTSGQRALITEKLPDVANISVGALVFGQFLSDCPFSISAAVFGAFLWTALVLVAFFCAGGE
jgi:hypothetical protein